MPLRFALSPPNLKSRFVKPNTRYRIFRADNFKFYVRGSDGDMCLFHWTDLHMKPTGWIEVD